MYESSSPRSWPHADKSFFHPVRGVTLSDEEATRLNMSTLPVKNGHATVFGFSHNIHCLVTMSLISTGIADHLLKKQQRFLRQVIHSDYYYPKETDEQRAEHIFHARTLSTMPHFSFPSSPSTLKPKPHISTLTSFFSSKPDHCLETIRLSVMCVPDLTPLELYWESQEGRKWEVAAKSDSQRECVKWEPLNEWMAPRHYNLNDLARWGPEFEIDETVGMRE